MRGVLRNSEEKARIVEAYASSGLSAKAFCKREGISPSTFYQWLANARAKAAPPPTVRVAKVLRGAVATPAQTLAIEIGSARIHVPRGFDPATLTAVIDLLAVRARS